MKFRPNQKVCQVAWKRGYPYIKFARITKVTTRTFYLDDEKKHAPEGEWHSSWEPAIEAEYLALFQMWFGPFRLGALGTARTKDWTIEDTVRCVCCVRRLEHKLKR